MQYRKIDINEVSSIIGKNYIGDNKIINGLNLVNRDSIYDSILSYCTNEELLIRGLKNPKVKCLIISKEMLENIDTKQTACTFFVVKNPEETFYFLHEELQKTIFYKRNNVDYSISKTSNIHKSCILEEEVSIGENVIIEPFVHIKKGTIIGDNCLIRSNSVIGAEGYQILKDNTGKPYLVNHVGGVKIGNNVSIGNNVTICKSLFEGYTIIGNNNKIDCQVHIGHNCEIGNDNCFVSGAILLGSVKIGNKTWIGPNTVILNKVIVEDRSFIGASSFVINNVKAATKVYGNPARVIEILK